MSSSIGRVHDDYNSYLWLCNFFNLESTNIIDIDEDFHPHFKELEEKYNSRSTKEQNKTLPDLSKLNRCKSCGSVPKITKYPLGGVGIECSNWMCGNKTGMLGSFEAAKEKWNKMNDRRNTMEILNNEEDFKWYKRELDLDARYEHEHIGTPKQYPCKVVSTWEDPPNRPYTYYHEFIYQEEYICLHCGHKSLVWPDELGKKKESS